MTSTWSHCLACDIFYLFVTLASISKKLENDGKMTTTTLPQQHTSQTYYQSKQKHLEALKADSANLTLSGASPFLTAPIRNRLAPLRVQQCLVFCGVATSLSTELSTDAMTGFVRGPYIAHRGNTTSKRFQ